MFVGSMFTVSSSWFLRVPVMVGRVLHGPDGRTSRRVLRQPARRRPASQTRTVLFFGTPAVYIPGVPASASFYEVARCSCRKTLFGYRVAAAGHARSGHSWSSLRLAE